MIFADTGESEVGPGEPTSEVGPGVAYLIGRVA